MLGKFSPFPGTLGSLASYITLPLIINSNPRFIFFLFILIFFIGSISSHIYASRKNKSDPKEVIIDEFLGQMIVLYFSTRFLDSSYSIEQILLFIFPIPFILFRFFDIKKPYIISTIDSKIKGGVGIMLDDVVAAIFASIPYILLLFFV